MKIIEIGNKIIPAENVAYIESSHEHLHLVTIYLKSGAIISTDYASKDMVGEVMNQLADLLASK